MKIRQRIVSGIDWIHKAITEPVHTLSEWQRNVLNWYEISRFCMRYLKQDRASQMAGALAFRTLFGMFPVLIVVTLAAKTMLGDKFKSTINTLISGVGFDNIQIIPPDGASTSGPVGLGIWLENLIDSASNLNLTALGWVGIAVVIFSALWVMVTIEKSFNVICRANQGRNWAKRILVYWFVLTVSPILVAGTIWLSNELGVIAEHGPQWHWLLVAGNILWSLLVLWLTLFVLYSWVPNTNVNYRCVAIGSLVGAILLQIGKSTLGIYMSNAMSVSQLYGSLGLIPLFMFWVYIMWLFVLFGLEVSAVLNALRGRTLQQLRPPSEHADVVDPSTVISIMEMAAKRFQIGKRITIDDLVTETHLDASILQVIADRLVARGLLLEVDDGTGFTLSRPPEQISTEALMEIGFELADDRHPGHLSSFIQKIRQAQRELAAQSNLASIIIEDTKQGQPGTPAV